MNDVTVWPSCSRACATSNKVVSTGKVFVIRPPGVCNANLASVYADAGFEVVGAVGAGADASATSGACPARREKKGQHLLQH